MTAFVPSPPDPRQPSPDPVSAQSAPRARQAASFPPRPARGDAAFGLWLANLAVGIAVGSLWLVHLPADLPLWLGAYVGVALISSVATLALVPGALFVGILRFVRSYRVQGYLLGFIGALFLALLYTDTVVYRLLRYHFNSAVLNVVVTPGSGDAVQLGPKVWVLVVTVLTGLTLIQRQVWVLLAQRGARRRLEGGRSRVWLRPRTVCALVLLSIVFVERSVTAQANISGDRAVRNVARPLPLLPPLRLGDLDAESAGEPAMDELLQGARLAYPEQAPVVDPDGARPSIFVLVLDSWRRDMFDPELTPRIAAFAETARVFEDHLSGGNGTRFGVFSMLYGLHGSYWFPVLEARRQPVLLDVLQEEGYELRVFSSASMNFPEFRDTAWAGLGDGVRDDYPEKLPWQRDRHVTDDVTDWLEERAICGDQRPFFCFVLLDAPHQPYTNPGGPFQPTVESLDYIELATQTTPDLVERVRNRYLNSVVYADGQAGRMLDALRDTDQLRDTVVMVTGDHGEEFQECGFWGHTSNFSPYQIQVPFVMRGPGIEPGSETRPTTHLDVPGTLLELLGADPELRRGYTLGDSLFDPPAERRRVVSGYADLGLWTPEGIVHLPYQTNRGPIDVYDYSWNLYEDSDARLEREHGALERMADECRRFLVWPGE